VEESNDRLIVVLGMHRSGTSAITRALKVLGVELGDRLMPAAEDDNDTGYWEDVDFNALNIEMLCAVGKDWFYTSPVTQADLEILDKQGYFVKAEKLLKEKLKDRKLFGLKDPRMAQLLAFWMKTFAKCDINVNYVLAIRHPLSVSKSLEKRAWQGRERIFLLWLNYVVGSLSLTGNTSRVIVDYDHLMRDSEHELERMAHSLNLSVDKKELVYYQSEFLNHNLQHSEYQPQDCGLDSDCPALAAEIYLKLQAVISESGCADDATFQQQVMQWAGEFDRLGPMLAHIDRALVESIQAAIRQREKESENSELRKKNAELNELTMLLRDQAVESHGKLSELAEQNEHRCRDIDALATQVTEIHSSTSWRITAPIRLVKKVCGALYLSLSSKRRNNNGFNADWYLEQNPDVKNRGQDPLAHYLEHGQTGGRARRPLSFLSRNRARLQIIASMTAQVIEKTGGLYAALTKTGRIIQREGWVSVKKHILHSYNVYKKPGAEQDYTNWIARYDTLTAASRSNLATKAETFEHQPLISVVMPVYNANSIWLAEAIDSVRHQVYQNWELCIADDASTEESVRSLLERYAGQDSRIKLVFSPPHLIPPWK
jgi:hypothetical protein